MTDNAGALPPLPPDRGDDDFTDARLALRIALDAIAWSSKTAAVDRLVQHAQGMVDRMQRAHVRQLYVVFMAGAVTAAVVSAILVWK